MIIRDILNAKGRNVVTTDPDQTVLGAMRLLVEHGIGAVVVVEGGGEALAGILSERDVLRLGADDPGKLGVTPVAEAMTPDPIVGTAGDSISSVMDLMTENRIRHLPIVEDGALAGIVSIGDVVNALRKSVEDENRHLTQYVRGEVR